MLLAIVAAMGLPALRRSAAKSSLRDAAGQLRVALAKARLEAIESGMVQTFRYQPDTGRYVLETHRAAAPQNDAPLPEEESQDEGDLAELPDGVVFLDPDDDEALPIAAEGEADATDGSRRIQVVDAEAIRAELTERDRAAWSRPIVFFPTGRSSQTRFRLLGQFGYWIELQLRGLTGTATLGQLQRPLTRDDLESRREEGRERDRPRAEPTPSETAETAASLPAMPEPAPEPPTMPEAPVAEERLP